MSALADLRAVEYPPSTWPLLSIVACEGAYAIVNKPAGLHSVPGRTQEKQDSIELRAREVFPDATGPLMVHRLDSETSGLMVVARTKDAHRRIQSQFMKRKVGKTYIAVLEGELLEDEGEVELPLSFDYPNRPRQKVDHESGRPARTLYRVIERGSGKTRVEFRPETGRTHQLRVHAATPIEQGGLGCPILGDTLYGDPSTADRLLLHADHLAFWDPVTHAWVKFRLDPEF